VIKLLKTLRTTIAKGIVPCIILLNVLAGRKPHELLPPGVCLIAIVGVILLVCGAILRIWARGHFFRGKLFTTGPYSIIRHPLYLGSFLIGLGITCQLNYWLNWIVMMSYYTGFYIPAVIYEERVMKQRFGPEWDSYKAQVPAFIPRLMINRAFGNSMAGWSWKCCLITGEVFSLPLFLMMPIIIEAMEETLF
jgi:protein-S-isoprenylcysteine O-methyltransferase Ste14